MTCDGRGSAITAILLLLTVHCTSLYAQTRVPLDQFEGWRNWPLLTPGDLAPDTGAIAPVRIEYDGLFPGPGGFGVPPLAPIRMLIDVWDVGFRGSPALWIQWTSRPGPGQSGVPALDALVVDRQTFALLFRIAASGRGSWGGNYEIIQAMPDSVIQVSVREDGSTVLHSERESQLFFDFAAYQFLFAAMELQEGSSFRLLGWEFMDKAPEVLAVHVVGRVNRADSNGSGHEVWRVDVMPPHEATLISFYVSPEAPYFHGWDYRLTRTGADALRLTLRSWTSTELRR